MKLKKDYKVRDIAGENVIVAIGRLNVDMTKVITLNASSRWLWDELQDMDFDTERIAEMLVDEYGIDRETALDDAGKWIDSLGKAGLLCTEGGV